MKMTPASALSHQAQTRPKSTAFIFHEDVWTYERLAVARKLAVILHRMWIDGTEFNWSRKEIAA